MQIVDNSEDRSGTLSVMGPSLALELDWTVHGCMWPKLRGAYPVLERLYSERPDLEQSVRGFWPDDMKCFAEVGILAHHAGALELTDFPALRGAVEATVESLPDDLTLASETPENRSAILARLAVLRDSSTRRDAYLDLLGELWSEVDEWWQVSGVPAVVRAAGDLRRDVERGADWRQRVSSECEALSRHLPDILDRQLAGQRILLAPTALFGKGYYMDLPGASLVGFGVARGDAARQTRTELVARRLRALADPTRLAILDRLADGPSTVSEIARHFLLSQPTVSVHVKTLREAGVVSADRRGVRLELAIDKQAVSDLAGDLTSLFSR
jgi:DNA-binding transcriptional ArsR family regulator